MMKKKLLALVLALTMALSLLPVAAMAAGETLEIGNHGYPWLQYSNNNYFVTLDVTGYNSPSYEWKASTTKDGEYTATGSVGSGMNCRNLNDMWVKCVVSDTTGTAETKPVYVQQMYDSYNNTTLYCITNGTVGYTTKGDCFDVYGKFGNEWVRTNSIVKPGDNWWFFTTRYVPNQEETSQHGTVKSFKGYFLDNDPYTVMLEATVLDGSNCNFAFGSDIGFGQPSVTTVTKDGDTVTGVQLVEAASLAEATDSTRSIVIKTPTTPNKYWLGSATGNSINGFAQGADDEYTGYDPGVSLSWTRRTGGTVIPFSFSVGTVAQTGASLDSAPADTYTVTFDANGHGTAPAAIGNLAANTVIDAPEVPTADGYVFAGWYKEPACVNEWDFYGVDKVSENTTLYAKWIEAYTITLDSSNYDGFYLKLDAYTNAGVWVGEIGNDDDPDEVTLSVPKDGYVVVGAAGNFTAAADGATVGDLQPSDELSYREITNFTKDTTIVINPKITVSEVTLKVDWDKVPDAPHDTVESAPGEEHYFTVTCTGLAGYVYGWVKAVDSGIGWDLVESDYDLIDGEKYGIFAEFGLQDGYVFADEVNLNVNNGAVAKIVGQGDQGMAVVFELGTLEDIEDAKDNAANTPTYTLDGTIAALGDDSIKVETEDGEEVVKFNIPENDGFFYYTMFVPGSALELIGMTPQAYANQYNNAADEEIIDVAGGDATTAHAMAAQVFPINMKDPSSSAKVTLDAEDGTSVAVIFKLHKDNYIYDDSTFGSTTPHVYAVYGVHAEIVTPSGTTGDNTGTDTPAPQPPVYYPSYDPTPVIPSVDVDIHDDTLSDAAKAVGSAVKSGTADITPVAGYTKESIAQMQKDNALKLVVEKKDSYDPAEKSLIDKAAQEKGKTSLVQFLEIDVTLRTMNDVIVAEVDDTIMDLTITVELNAEMQKAAKEGKTIYVARAHDGKVTFIEGTLNAEKTKFTFDSSKFSTYALVASDSQTVTSPKTADAGIFMAVSMSVLSVTGSAVLLKKKED